MDAAKAFLEVFYSNTSLPQDTRKISNKQPNLTPKGTRERKTKLKNQLKRNHKENRIK